VTALPAARFLLLLALLLGSCAQRTATVEQCKSLAAPKAILQRCFDGDLQHGKYVGELKCWQFSPTKRTRGVWFVGLEASELYPSAEALRQNRGSGPGHWRPQVWFDTKLLDSRPELRAAGGGAGERIYSVEFDGRQSLCNGKFGHFGNYPREVVAERFYSMRLLATS
jgi:hypothetical protein